MASKASESILSAKREIIDEIKDKIQGAQSVVLMSYQGLTAAQDTEMGDFAQQFAERLCR